MPHQSPGATRTASTTINKPSRMIRTRLDHSCSRSITSLDGIFSSPSLRERIEHLSHAVITKCRFSGTNFSQITLTSALYSLCYSSSCSRSSPSHRDITLLLNVGRAQNSIFITRVGWSESQPLAKETLPVLDFSDDIHNFVRFLLCEAT